MTKVRFAPSPTGYLHVGGARTALFNWLYARHNNGKFVLRIEDTDQNRSTEESIKEIKESLEWLGLNWDEYYRQTEQQETYEMVAKKLLDKGLVYIHEDAWWFKVSKEGKTVVNDQLLGDVTFDHEQLKDLVIRRSDGSFVYNFVVVVDDANEGITHVIRGDDHLNNTPKQILLYQALGRPLPKFLHLPMILGPDKSRLSKRHGVTSVLEYRRHGFLPEAMINFLARLGWSHGDQEVFTVDELIDLFSFDSVGSSAAMFDNEKLRWLNQQHLKSCETEKLLELVKPFVVANEDITNELWARCSKKKLELGIDLLRDRCHTLSDLAGMMRMLFPVSLETEVDVSLNGEKHAHMQAVVDSLEELDLFTAQAIEQAVRQTLEKRGVGLGAIAKAMRVEITGKKVGPGLFEIASAIGQELVAKRLTDYLKRINQ